MSDIAVFQLFVYGSLRSGFQNPAYEYISRYFDLVGPAKVRGKLFDMGDYPAAIPFEEDSFIVGELYRIRNENEFTWAMCQLDDYEGVLVEQHDQPLYRREICQVTMDQKTLPAWIYWYNGEVSGRPPIESGDILTFLKNK